MFTRRVVPVTLYRRGRGHSAVDAVDGDFGHGSVDRTLDGDTAPVCTLIWAVLNVVIGDLLRGILDGGAQPEKFDSVFSTKSSR